MIMVNMVNFPKMISQSILVILCLVWHFGKWIFGQLTSWRLTISSHGNLLVVTFLSSVAALLSVTPFSGLRSDARSLSTKTRCRQSHDFFFLSCKISRGQIFTRFWQLKNEPDNDRSFATVRISALQANVTWKKFCILWPWKRVKLTQMFHQT